MARGADIEVIVWIAAVVIWTLFKVLGKFIGKTQKQTSRTKQSPKKVTGSLQDMLSQFEPFLTQTQPPSQPEPIFTQQTPVKTAPPPLTPPPQPVVAKPPKENVWLQEAAMGNMSNLVFSSGGNSLKMPAVRFPSATFSDKKHSVNKLRPDWKNGNQVRQAVLASIILGRPVGDPKNTAGTGEF